MEVVFAQMVSASVNRGLQPWRLISSLMTIELPLLQITVRDEPQLTRGTVPQLPITTPRYLSNELL